MENRPFGPEEQDDESEKKSSKKKRGGSALSRYLGGLRRKEEQGAESADTPELERPKRMRRLFGKLFPRIVEQPAAPSEATASQETEHQFDHETWFSWTKLASQRGEQPSDAEPATERQQPVLQTPETPPHPESLSGAEQPDTGEEIAPDQPTTPEVSIADDRAVEVTNSPETDQEIPEAVLYSREPQPDVPETTERSHGTPPPEKREVVIERRGNVALPAALVGLEYLARKKADRKLETRLNEKMSATAEAQQGNSRLQEELEQVVRQNREQLDALKRARTGTVEAPRVAPEYAPRTTERVETRQVRPKNPEYSRPAAATESIRPQNIMERVADAAEHDVPVERAFERSHEVKDDEPAVATGATSVGAVVSTYALQAGKPSSNAPSAQESSQGSLPVISGNPDPLSYKRAAAAGFWSAVAIMVLGAIAWLVIK